MGNNATEHHDQLPAHSNSNNNAPLVRRQQQLKTLLTTTLSRKRRQFLKVGAAFILIAYAYYFYYHYYLWSIPKGLDGISEQLSDLRRLSSRPTLSSRRCLYPSYVLRPRDISPLLYDDEEDLEEDPTWRARVGSTPQRQHSSNYTVIYNFLSPSADDQPIAGDAVTLVTHCTPDLILPHVVDLLRAWPSPHPLSVAVYSPGREFCLAWALLSWLWRCGDPDDSLGLRRRLHFHVFFRDADTTAVSAETAARQSGGIGLLEVDCLQKPPLDSKYGSSDLPYPSNAASNIARLAVLTDLALTQDIDLVPSPGLAQHFLHLTKESSWHRNAFLFAVLAFEVDEIPSDKTSLAELYSRERAQVLRGDSGLPFNVDSWLNTSVTEGVTVFANLTFQPSAKWLPFYIGNNSVPLLEERLFHQADGKVS